MPSETGISDSSVGRIWRAHGLKPHRVDSFKISNDPRFAEKLEDIVGLYLNPPEHALVLSVDEKSQIQALDRTQPSLPLKTGHGATITSDYKRNGTTTLFAALDTANGEVYGFCQQKHRHQEWLKFLGMIDDTVSANKETRLKAQSKDEAKRLKNMRWSLLRKGSRVRGEARKKLNALIASKLDTARAWELKEAFLHFWKYKSPIWAGAFLDYWCHRAMRSRLEPMQKVAHMLRAHEGLLLNWFRAKGEVSSGAVEGLNNKIRVITRRSFGFRTFKAMEIALYHTLGRLPEPETTHRFC
jgi:hypothetical protein